jgi:DNA oxidative demethylase
MPVGIDPVQDGQATSPSVAISDTAMPIPPLAPELFGDTPLPGLSLVADIIGQAEEQALIEAIDAAGLAPFRFHGWAGKRLTASYGWRYDFDDASFGPTEPLPAWLLPLRATAAALVGMADAALVHALLIRYDPGAGIGWHRDRAVFEHVVGISLGAPATMRFRRRRSGGFDRATTHLAPCSLYHLTGPARHQWEHSIAPMDAPRWSITFRSLSEKGRRHAAVTPEDRPAPPAPAAGRRAD